MPVIVEKVVKSRYRGNHKIFTKTIKFDAEKGINIKNVIDHKERIFNISCTPAYKYVDVTARLDIYFTYYLEEKGEVSTYSSILEEEVFVRIFKDSFNPMPYSDEFRQGNFVAYIRRLTGKFDIDLTGSTLSIAVSSFLVVNLLKERCIYLEDKKRINFDELSLNQVAVSSENSSSDIRNYINHLDDITRALSKRLDWLEEENSRLKEEIERKENDINALTMQYLDEKRKNDLLSKECTRLLERLKEMEEKYEKEQKRVNLLEVENSRNMDEIKSLKKERNELLLRVDKEKNTWKDKIKKFMNKG
ncbi:hypothetical protein [Fonticella tunisiensis]|uniref:Uncharacterized protein n=1 Tax=Fonticella tunisiensis TaxID=1096341 RepID=A0A4R7KPH8_9CLOT|nr:hypothetical protein [Fonticella tunisiensis]TDT61039.1 hypothetical protein EDD71_10943 [Fonticella tunisiensis]